MIYRKGPSVRQKRDQRNRTCRFNLLCRSPVERIFGIIWSIPIDNIWISCFFFCYIIQIEVAVFEICSELFPVARAYCRIVDGGGFCMNTLDISLFVEVMW